MWMRVPASIQAVLPDHMPLSNAQVRFQPQLRARLAVLASQEFCHSHTLASSLAMKLAFKLQQLCRTFMAIRSALISCPSSVQQVL
jgi:hypothetical protein